MLHAQVLSASGPALLQHLHGGSGDEMTIYWLVLQFITFSCDHSIAIYWLACVRTPLQVNLIAIKWYAHLLACVRTLIARRF